MALCLLQVDTESGKQWRYTEIPQWVSKCGQRLREINVTSSSCIALVSSVNPVAMFVLLTGANMRCRLAPMNGFLSVGEQTREADMLYTI